MHVSLGRHSSVLSASSVTCGALVARLSLLNKRKACDADRHICARFLHGSHVLNYILTIVCGKSACVRSAVRLHCVFVLLLILCEQGQCPQVIAFYRSRSFAIRCVVLCTAKTNSSCSAAFCVSNAHILVVRDGIREGAIAII